MNANHAAHPITRRFVCLAMIVASGVLLGLAGPAHALIDIWIDPGHGGADKGNLGIDGGAFPNEKDVTLPLAAYLNDRLYNYVYTCYQTRYTDTTLALSARVAMARGALANQRGERDSAQLFLSIHLNSKGVVDANGKPVYDASRGSQAIDSTVYGTEIQLQDTKIRKAFQQLGLSGNYATAIHDNMIGGINAQFTFCHHDRGIKREDLYVLRQNPVPALLIEVCFYSNRCSFDDINHSTTQAAVADAIATGVTHTSFCQVLICGSAQERPIAQAEAAPSATVAGPRNPRTEQAQVVTFSEGFEGGTFPPAGWSTQTAGAPAPSTWGVSADTAIVFDGTQSAFVRGEYTGTSDEWLIRHSLRPTAGIPQR